MREGTVSTSDFGEATWQNVIPKRVMRDSFSRYVKEHQIRSRIPDDTTFSKTLKKCLRQVKFLRMRFEEEGRVRVYELPGLDDARESFEKFIGHNMEWGE